MSFSRATRLLIRERSDGICEWCHRLPARQMHHRAARGMGGSSAPWVDLPSNGLDLCGTNASGCHGRATETDVAEARSAKIVVPYAEADRKGGCAQIPYWDDDDVCWLLADDGSKTKINNPTTEQEF